MLKSIGSDNEPSEKEYFESRIEERLYISKQFEDLYSKKKKRFVNKIHQSVQQEKFVKLKNEIVLSVKHGGRYQLKALVLEDTKGILSLVIQTFTEATGNPHNAAFSFHGLEIENLYKFLKGIKKIPFDGKEAIKIDDKVLDELLLTKEQATKIVSDNLDIVVEVVRNEVTKSDIVALGYRKSQLEKFKHLIVDEDYFKHEMKKLNLRGKESVWQNFFEVNTWIFGYGLSYIFNSQLDDKKLEQVVVGYNFTSSGKRIDALMKTRGVINSLCFGEIKTHQTKLLKEVKDAYRLDCWAVSDELSGAIAQIQKTVHKSVKELTTKIELKDKLGDPSGDEVYIYQPKAFVVIGNLSEFKTENGVNENKFSSFELFRQNLINPEIITFDELYERAKFIVRHLE